MERHTRVTIGETLFWRRRGLVPISVVRRHLIGEESLITLFRGATTHYVLSPPPPARAVPNYPITAPRNCPHPGFRTYPATRGPVQPSELLAGNYTGHYTYESTCNWSFIGGQTGREKETGIYKGPRTRCISDPVCLCVFLIGYRCKRRYILGIGRSRRTTITTTTTK